MRGLIVFLLALFLIGGLPTSSCIKGGRNK